MGGQTSYFLYDGAALLATLDANGNITGGYSWGQDGLIADKPAAGGERFYSFDPMGSTSGIWSMIGNAVWQGAYSAWGQSLTGQTPNSYFLFKGRTGNYTDPTTGMVGFNNGGQPYVPALGRLATPGGSLNPYASPGNDPVNTGVYADDTAADDWVFPGGSVPSQRQLYAPFLRQANGLAEDGKVGLQFAASLNPLYNAGEALTGRDAFNHKVPWWQQGLDILGTLLPVLGEVGPAIKEARAVGSLAKYPEWGPYHHLLPQAEEFAQFFGRAGLKIDEHTTQLDVLYHRNVVHGGGSNGGAWNARWRDFKDSNPFAEADAIIAYRDQLRKEFKIDHLPVEDYPAHLVRTRDYFRNRGR